MPETPSHARWRIAQLITCLTIATLAVCGWVLPASRALWDAWDMNAFYFFNGWLAAGEGMQIFWAILSTRTFDMLSQVTLVLLFIHFIRAGGKADIFRRLSVALFILITGLIFIQLQKHFALPRYSPSLTLTPVLDLNLLVPWLSAKVGAKDTFPSDHGTGMFIITSFLWFFAGRRYGLPAALLTVLFCLPRLVAGAHWLSDILVGSFTVSVMAYALCLATPLHARPLILIERAMDCFPRIKKLGGRILCYKLAA